MEERRQRRATPPPPTIRGLLLSSVEEAALKRKMVQPKISLVSVSWSLQVTLPLGGYQWPPCMSTARYPGAMRTKVTVLKGSSGLIETERYVDSWGVY